MGTKSLKEFFRSVKNILSDSINIKKPPTIPFVNIISISNSIEKLF